ncbi:MAG: NfeD family protein [Acidimicrobiales bacterium]
MRRLPILLPLAITFATVLGALSLTGSAAAAQPATPAGGVIDVIEVVGLVDPVQADFVTEALAGAESGGAVALVIQVNSSGGVLSRAEMDGLVFRLTHARVPVAAWVGPSGGRALGQGWELIQAAGISGVASRGRVGPRGATVSADQAFQQGLVDISAPTLGDFIVELDGRQVGDDTLETAEVIREPGQQPRRRPTVEVRFAKLDLVARLLHSAASPSVAFLLLAAGLALAVLELYTAGIGVSAATGAVCLVLACYGLGVLPVRPWAVTLILLGMLGYAIDVQAGAPRVWTAIGTAALGVGGLSLYEQGLRPSPLVLVTVIGGVAFMMVSGMPAVVRSRFSTATIGREAMIGEEGSALAAVAPEGTVEIRGAQWRARTNRATPIAVGQAVRVVAIDGLLLEVEPTEGGAKDAHH